MWEPQSPLASNLVTECRRQFDCTRKLTLPLTRNRLQPCSVNHCSSVSASHIFTCCCIRACKVFLDLQSCRCFLTRFVYRYQCSDQLSTLPRSTQFAVPLRVQKISDAQAESDLCLLVSRIRELTMRELCGAPLITAWSGRTQPGCDVALKKTDHPKDK